MKPSHKNGTGIKCLPVPFLAVFLFSTLVSAAEPTISRVSLAQKTIDLARNEKAVIEFQLSHESFIDLEIYDEANALVRKIAGEKTLKKGKRSVVWDGKDDKGEQVASGVYVYVLEARGTKPYRFDPRKETGGEEVFVEKLSWDVPKKTISYLLPKISYARIRIGLKEGVFLGTLQDWMPFEAGQKEFPWDGRDPSGHFDLSNHEDAQINIAAFALPDNAVIVKSDAGPSLRGGRKADEAIPNSEIASLPAVARNDGRVAYIHDRHLRFRCHEPKFSIEFPDAELDSETKAPILKDKTPLRITLDPEDKDYLVSNRFEVMFFVDAQFLFEQEEGTSPFTIDLDSAQFGAGEHLLTINVMDYEDHIGVQTVKVKVEPFTKTKRGQV